jgi:hypothetical protein
MLFLFSSSSEVKALQLLAKQNELTFIPLIQTFGHFEVGDFVNRGLK